MYVDSFITILMCFRSSQQSTSSTSTPEPSVAPYPPLRLVPRTNTSNTLPSPPPEGSVFR